MEYVKLANRAFSVAKINKKISTANENAKKIQSAVDIKRTYTNEMGTIEITLPYQHKLFKKRMAMDLSVLQTMLERVSSSNNENLINDIIKHQIPKRLEHLTTLVIQYEDRGFHNLGDAESQDLDLIVEEIECIKEQTEALILANLLSKPIMIRL